MNENGRKADFLIEDKKYRDQQTGVEIPATRSFTVWCDECMKSVIADVDGVTNVYNSMTKTEMDVFIDARYDMKTVQSEIIAAIQNAIKSAEEE